MLKKGENVIVLKVCQNDQKEPWAQDWKFQMRVCDDTGGPLGGLTQLVSENGEPKKIKLGFNPNPTEAMRGGEESDAALATQSGSRRNPPFSP